MYRYSRHIHIPGEPETGLRDCWRVTDPKGKWVADVAEEGVASFLCKLGNKIKGGFYDALH